MTLYHNDNLHLWVYGQMKSYGPFLPDLSAFCRKNAFTFMHPCRLILKLREEQGWFDQKYKIFIDKN